MYYLFYYKLIISNAQNVPSNAMQRQAELSEDSAKRSCVDICTTLYCPKGARELSGPFTHKISLESNRKRERNKEKEKKKRLSEVTLLFLDKLFQSLVCARYRTHHKTSLIHIHTHTYIYAYTALWLEHCMFNNAVSKDMEWHFNISQT